MNSLFERAVRAINVQLATSVDAPVVALAATNAGRLLRLDVRIDRGRDQLIGAAGPVLVDDRGPFAVVPHAGHQVPQPGAAYRRGPGLDIAWTTGEDEAGSLIVGFGRDARALDPNDRDAVQRAIGAYLPDPEVTASVPAPRSASEGPRGARRATA